MADDPKEEIPQIETPENNLDKGEELLSDSPNTINALDLAGQNSEHISLAPSNQHLNVSGNSLNSNEAANTSSYEQEVVRLRDVIKEKEDGLAQMERRLNEVEAAARTHAEQINQQFSAKLEESIRSIKESSQRDKNSMVMKYVEGEKRCIELNRHVELLQSKLNDAHKDKQRMNERFESIRAEMEKLNAENDKKLKELMTQKKEIERQKELVVLSDAREKAAQLKLTKEIEAHAGTQRQLEQATVELTQLKNQEAANGETQRLQLLEQERKVHEMSLNKYKETLQSQKQMNKDLLDEILQLRESQETLTKEQNEKKQLEDKLKVVSTELNELQSEMKLNQEKQGELLAFTAKLTDKNTQLQSENNALKERLQHIESDFEESNKTLKESNQNLATELKKLKENLDEKLNKSTNLEKEIDTFRDKNEELTNKLAESCNELATLKKKHASNIKDLTRQIQQLEKKLTTCSAPSSNNTVSGLSILGESNHPMVGKTSVSRENSVGSFSIDKDTSIGDQAVGNLIDDDHLSLESAPNVSIANRYQHEVLCDGIGGNGGDDVYVFDIDKQKLIEKIVRLQKKLAKSNEKVDFLQDHVNQLTEDLKKKTRIIQAYALKEDTGAFTSEAQDAIKREMSKKTGIMSTLYNTNKSYVQTANFIKLNESNMTMDLCLEINAKLQALLEDTLIKNITLKESLETLGTEIARLSQENRKIKLNQ